MNTLVYESINNGIEESLINARNMANVLFDKIQSEGFVAVGAKESELNGKVYKLAEELFGIKKYWHKRIVRAGKNTLCPYRENPEDVTLQENDVVYFDFGPILEHVEADFGRTYVVGSNPEHQVLLEDLNAVWEQCRKYFLNDPSMTGNRLYTYMSALAKDKGYELAEWHCGHLVGIFPHEERLGEEKVNYICLENNVPMNEPATDGEVRYWILEVHLTKPDKNFGGFVEDLLLSSISL